MTVLRESPWYQEIRQEGRQEGEQTGVLKGEQALILRQLTRRIGEVAPEIRAQVQALSLTQLEALGEALLDFSEPADLDKWLHSQ
jgi:predicted transposase YdaD